MENHLTVCMLPHSKGLLRITALAALISMPVARGHEESKEGNESLAATVSRLDEFSGEVEVAKDVKCRTFFKQLEEFVAGCQIDPTTTHLKTAAVHAWKTAAPGGSDPISAEEFDAASRQRFPQTGIELLNFTVRMGERTVEIPYHDVQNLEDTVDPTRLLRNLALEKQHSTIQDEDLIEVDRRIAALLGIAPLDRRESVDAAGFRLALRGLNRTRSAPGRAVGVRR